MAPPQEPQAGLLGGLPEEGLVVIGDDSSLRLTAIEDLPVGQGVEVGDSALDDPGPV